MAPPAVARRLVLLITSWRGTPFGDENRVVDTVRARLKGLPKKPDDVQLQSWLAWGFATLVDYAIGSFTLNGLVQWDDETFGDRLFEMMKVALTKTKIMSRFSSILDDDVEWQEQVRVLLAHRDGTPIPNPLYVTGRGAVIGGGPGPHFAWWSRRWAVSLFFFVGALIFSIATALVESGRARLNCFGLTLLCALVGWLWRKCGCDIPCPSRAPAQVVPDDDDDATEDSSSAASEPSTPRTVRSPQDSSVLKEILDGQKKLAERISCLRTETEEIWNSLENAEKNLLEIVSCADYDTSR